MIWHKEVLEFPSLLKAMEQTFDEAVEACALDTWNGQHEVGNRRQLRNRAEEEELQGNSFVFRVVEEESRKTGNPGKYPWSPTVTDWPEPGGRWMTPCHNSNGSFRSLLLLHCPALHLLSQQIIHHLEDSTHMLIHFTWLPRLVTPVFSLHLFSVSLSSQVHCSSFTLPIYHVTQLKKGRGLTVGR